VSFEAKISIDIQQTSYFFLTFYDFLIRRFKKRKKSCFSEKKRKIRILEHCNEPSFWLKIFSKATSPIFSRCFCMTLRMLQYTKHTDRL